MVRNSKEDVAAPMLFFTIEVADKMEKIKVTVLDINLFFWHATLYIKNVEFYPKVCTNIFKTIK